MFVRIVRNGDKGTVRQHTYQCSHVQVTLTPQGTEFECSDGRVLRIPDEGDVVYFMNNRGDTIDRYRWPPEDEEGIQE